MFTFDFLKYTVETISIILSISLVILTVVYLAYTIYSEYFDLAKAVAKVLISIMLGLICFPVMTLALLYIFYNLIKYLQTSPYVEVVAIFLVFFAIPLAIPVSLYVSFMGSVFISIISGFVIHKSLK